MATTDLSTIDPFVSTDIACTKCHVPRPPDQFHYKKSGKINQPCKECRSVTAKASRAARTPDQRETERVKEQIRGKKRKPRVNTLARKAQIRARMSAWRLAHPEEDTERNRAWRAANPDKVQAASERYTSTHRETVSTRSAEWRAANPEKAHASKKAWNQAHPEECQAHNKSRRARKRNTPVNDFTQAQWKEVQAAQDHCCAHCGKRCKGRLTRDHITPLGPQGRHTLHNIVAVCSSCNSKKQTKTSPVLVQPLLLTIAPAKPYTPRKVQP